MERYGHYSLAAESQYDHPFQWGSKRTGPDLARVGGPLLGRVARRPLRWNPQSVVPESVMPAYAFLADNVLRPTYIVDLMRTHRMVGVPYTDEMLEMAQTDFIQQATDFGDAGVVERYPGAQQRDFDGQPEVTEMDALIAYMQMLGTLVDFSTFTPEEAMASR